MSAFRYIRNDHDRHGFRILHGNDSDVTWFTIVRFSHDRFIVTRTFDNEFTMTLNPTVEVWNGYDLKKEFELQYGSPMHYMSQEDYEWLIEKKDA